MGGSFDLPLDELKVYQGAGIKPADLDAFWDEKIKHCQGVELQCEWQEASFQSPVADCYELRFTGVDGAEIFVQALLPKDTSKPVPAIMQFHGYSANGGDWIDKLSWVSSGYAVYAMDCRGQGGQSHDAGQYRGWTLSGHICRGAEEGPHSLYYVNVYQDICILNRLIASDARIDASRIIAMGGSQGGGLTMACAALCADISRAYVLYPFLSDFKRVWAMDLAKDAYDDINIWLKRFSPTSDRHDELFATLAYIDVANLAPRIQAPVLFATGLADTICPPSTQFAAYNQLTSPKKILIYPEHGHENLPRFWDAVYQDVLENQ